MTVETALTFKAGDPVPEWLLYVDPKSPDAVRPKAEFTVSGIIVLFEESYWLLSSETSAPYLIRFSDGSDCSIGALERDVVLPIAFHILRAVEGATA